MNFTCLNLVKRGQMMISHFSDQGTCSGLSREKEEKMNLKTAQRLGGEKSQSLTESTVS